MVIIDEVVEKNYSAKMWVIRKYLGHSLINEMVPKYFSNLRNAQHRHEVLTNVQIGLVI
jgi:hypothetical protein